MFVKTVATSRGHLRRAGTPPTDTALHTLMELSPALAFARPRRDGVLATIRSDGRPQLSNILYHLGPDDVVRISANAGAAKLVNLARDGRAALHVTSDDFGAYIVIEGTTELTPPAAAPHDPTVEQLVEWYRAAAGEHPDWDDFRHAMVADRRVLIALRAERAYGYIPADGVGSG